jgi:hypothetical protein
MDEQRDKYGEAFAALESANAELEKAIVGLARENNANPADVVNLMALQRNKPDEFESLRQRVSQAATESDQSAKATRTRLQQAAQNLYEALQQENNATDADRLRAFSLLGHLRAQLDRMAES